MKKQIVANKNEELPAHSGSDKAPISWITVMWQQGQSIWDDGYSPKQISPDWKVSDLVTDIGGLPFRSMRLEGGDTKWIGVMHLVGPAATLDLDDPASFEKPLSVLGVSEGCQVALLYGNR